MFNVSESAKYIGVKNATIRAWVLNRRIESVRVGRAVRIRRSVLDRVLERGTIPADRNRAIA